MGINLCEKKILKWRNDCSRTFHNKTLEETQRGGKKRSFCFSREDTRGQRGGDDGSVEDKWREEDITHLFMFLCSVIVSSAFYEFY